MILEVVQEILELPAKLEAVSVCVILELTDRNESTVVAQIERGGLIPDLSLLKMRELQRLYAPVYGFDLLDHLHKIRRLIVVERLTVKGAVHKGVQDLRYSRDDKCLNCLRIRVGRDRQTKLLAEGLLCSLAALWANHPTCLVCLDTQLLYDIS